ncbi:MAG: hypothetical protein O2890_01895 [Cyanobacteria bacterium]|nr:hypothetical protein [Cyanobacteriota bacterium]MDA0865171.1 hypothetical protein [Cyanobacteriota bacterium]
MNAFATIPGLLVMGAGLLNPGMVYGQSSTVDSCESALIAGEGRLNDVPNVSVTIFSTRDISGQYQNPPAGRSVEIIFGMGGIDSSGSAADGPVNNVLNSPVMMAEIATHIFEACTATGIVTFGLDGTGLKYSLGWTSDGPLKFECSLEADEWGEMSCD